MEGWFKKIRVPISFSEAGMPADELDALADDALITAEHWGIETYNKDMVLEILKLCI